MWCTLRQSFQMPLNTSSSHHLITVKHQFTSWGALHQIEVYVAQTYNGNTPFKFSSENSLSTWWCALWVRRCWCSGLPSLWWRPLELGVDVGGALRAQRSLKLGFLVLGLHPAAAELPPRGHGGGGLWSSGWSDDESGLIECKGKSCQIEVCSYTWTQTLQYYHCITVIISAGIVNMFHKSHPHPRRGLTFVLLLQGVWP